MITACTSGGSYSLREVEIVRCRYNPIGVDKTGYPRTVTIKMKDGKAIVYKR